MATKKNKVRKPSRASKNETDNLKEIGLELFATAVAAGVSTLWDKLQKWHADQQHSSKNQSKDNSFTSTNPPIQWWRVLGVKMYASAEDIEKAFREKIAKVHPDKVSHLSEKLQEVADLEARLLIEARRQGLARFAQ